MTVTHDTMQAEEPEPAAAPLDELVEAWVRDGLISPEQAAALLARGTGTTVRPAPRRHAGTSLAVEALGYLGGMIMVVAAFLLTSMFWDRMGDPVRVGILGAVALGLIAGGFAVPRAARGPGVRLRSVLWLAGTVAVPGALGIGVNAYTTLEGPRLVLAIAAGALVVAVGLWLLHQVLVQQVAMVAAVIATTVAAFLTVDEQSTPGFAVWVIGLCWFTLGQLGWLRPKVAVRVLGALTAMIGLLATLDYDTGIVLGLMTATVAVVLAVLITDLPLLVAGSLGMLVYVQIGMRTWLDNSLAAVVALLLVGLGLVGVAIWVARRRSGRLRHHAFAR